MIKRFGVFLTLVLCLTQTAFASCEKLIQAVKHGDLKEVVRLLDEDKNKDVNCKDTTSGKTLLHVAVETNGSAYCEKEEWLGMWEGWKKSSHHYDVPNSHLPIIHELIQRGAQVNARDNDGRTPLHEAVSRGAYYGGVNSADVLIENGADKSITDNYGMLAQNFIPWAFGVERARDSFEVANYIRNASAGKKVVEEIAALGIMDNYSLALTGSFLTGKELPTCSNQNIKKVGISSNDIHMDKSEDLETGSDSSSAK